MTATNGLKKTGVTLVAGGCVGILASAALGGDLVATGDFGNFNSPYPDGAADRVVIDAANFGVEFVYTMADGLNIIDDSGLLVDCVVEKAGEGYGQNINGSAEVWHRSNNASPFAEWSATDVPGWFVEATMNSNGTGGSGAAVSYRIDGPAGYYAYYGGWHDLYHTSHDRYYDREAAGWIDIYNGGTGYWPGSNNGNADFDSYTGCQPGNYNKAGSLTLTIAAPTGGDIGSFGVVCSSTGPGGAGGVSTEDPTMQPYSAATWGPGIWDEEFAVLDGVQNTNKSFYICNDNADPADGAAWNAASSGQAGNYRLYLGHTPPACNYNALSWAATGPGQVANLDIHPNSTPTVGINQVNGTSGIGYTDDGTFTIYDADGKMVTGVTIKYETDSAGRVYCWGKGSYLRDDGTNPSTGGPFGGNNINQTSGWWIDSQTTTYASSAGWTLVPQGNGFGFDCRGIHLWGQIVKLPDMSCSTNGQSGSYNVESQPELGWAGGGIVPTEASGHRWGYDTWDVPTGKIVGADVWRDGSNYQQATEDWIMPNTDDTGDGGELSGVIGAVARRYISDADGNRVEADLAGAGYGCFPNCDFNGDGYSDLLWRSPIYGCAIWNMGVDGRVICAKTIIDPGADWALVAVGKYGYPGTGACLFWYNTLTGENAVWAVNSSDCDGDWLVGGQYTMTSAGDSGTVTTLTTTPRCGNNPVQNVGWAIYWQDAAGGEMAYWPVSLSANASAATIGDGAHFLQDDGNDILLPSEYGWDLTAVGDMYGRPNSQGHAGFRDIVLTSYGGETAVWIMGGNYYSIDRSALDKGAGFTNQGGSNTVQNYYLCGIGQYLVTSTFAATNAADPIPGEVTARPTWFCNLYWCLPGTGSGFSWKMDRNIDLIDFRADPTDPTGNGYLVNPYAITGTSAVY